MTTDPVRCWDCGQFVPNARTPEFGVGRCRIDNDEHTRSPRVVGWVPLWAQALRWCRLFVAREAA